MILNSLYEILGELIIIAVIVIIVLFLIVLVFGKYIIKHGGKYFPRFILFVVDVLYSPFKTISKLLKMDEHFIDNIAIRIRDDVNKEKFKKIPAEETLIFLPHCLRHKDCPATLQKAGLNCTECGLCSIGVIKKKAEKLVKQQVTKKMDSYKRKKKKIICL